MAKKCHEFINTPPCLHRSPSTCHSTTSHNVLVQAANRKRLGSRVQQHILRHRSAFLGTRRLKRSRSHRLRPRGYSGGFASTFLRQRKNIAGTSQPRVRSSPCSLTSISKSSPEKKSASSPVLNEFRQREAFNVLTARSKSA